VCRTSSANANHTSDATCLLADCLILLRVRNSLTPVLLLECDVPSRECVAQSQLKANNYSAVALHVK
jgi:hypothetical protein